MGRIRITSIPNTAGIEKIKCVIVHSGLITPVSTGDIRYSRFAAEILSAWVCVRCDSEGRLIRGDNCVENQDLLLGVLMHAVCEGEIGTVLQQGIVTDSSFSRFAPGDVIFVGNDGTLVNTPVSMGFLQIVGRMIAVDTIAFRFGTAVLMG